MFDFKERLAEKFTNAQRMAEVGRDLWTSSCPTPPSVRAEHQDEVPPDFYTRTQSILFVNPSDLMAT